MFIDIYVALAQSICWPFNKFNFKIAMWLLRIDHVCRLLTFFSSAKERGVFRGVFRGVWSDDSSAAANACADNIPACTSSDIAEQKCHFVSSRLKARLTPGHFSEQAFVCLLPETWKWAHYKCERSLLTGSLHEVNLLLCPQCWMISREGDLFYRLL